MLGGQIQANSHRRLVRWFTQHYDTGLVWGSGNANSHTRRWRRREQW